jgi:hypothetical protein
MGSRIQQNTALQTEGLTRLQRDLQLSCRPHRCTGESLEQFVARVAASYFAAPDDVRTAVQ